jgi:formylglycine-generating enzyme required for sulfatase activity/serine/threonine protein kinase
MLAFMQCVGQAIQARGMRGLLGFVPFGEQLYEVAADAVKRYKEQRRERQMAADLQQVLQAGAQELRDEAARIAREAGRGLSVEEQNQLRAYLLQLQMTARQALRRADDPTGTTVPASLFLDDPAQFASVLPKRPPKFQAGQRVPNATQWIFEDLLGAGGFGEVWLASHSKIATKKKQAFKFWFDKRMSERFSQRELDAVLHASAAVREDEDGIVPLVDAHLESETPWLAYEFIQGGDLSATIISWRNLDKTVRAQKALAMLHRLAQVVGKFHRLPEPITHRDLKPANILIQRVGKRDLLRITDFGISKIFTASKRTDGKNSTANMSLSETFHTPLYASPQQKRGEKADVRDDVYSLAIIGYQMIVGDVTADRPVGKWRNRVEEYGIDSRVLALLESAWDDDPNERPSDALDFATKLEALSRKKRPDEEKPIRPAKPIPDRRSKASGKKWMVPLGIALLICAVIAGVYIFEARKKKLEEAAVADDGSSARPAVPKGFGPGAPKSGPGGGPKRDPMADFDETIGKPQVLAVNGVEFKFMYCPPGKFTMGRKNQKDAHEVTISKGFYMLATEVSQKQWKAVMGEDSNPSSFKGDDLPVERVTWAMCQEFCQKMNEKMKFTGKRIRLPTEAQWEYACRAGSTTDYFNGDDEAKLAEIGWLKKNSDKEPHPVGVKSPNKWGLHDMHGNVYEWCEDYYGDYSVLKENVDPVQRFQVGGSRRVCRGGGWGSNAEDCSATYRDAFSPGGAGRDLGFRVLAVPVGE